jgi:hypothetical protein
MSSDYLSIIEDHIKSKAKLLTDVECLVMDILIMSYNSGEVLTQKDIIHKVKTSGGSLGSHPREKGVGLESQQRQLRSIIECLRKDYQMPICSGSDGYYIPHSSKEMTAYMERTEKTSAAAAQSHIATFNSLASVWSPHLKTRISIT